MEGGEARRDRSADQRCAPCGEEPSGGIVRQERVQELHAGELRRHRPRHHRHLREPLVRPGHILRETRGRPQCDPVPPRIAGDIRRGAALSQGQTDDQAPGPGRTVRLHRDGLPPEHKGERREHPDTFRRRGLLPSSAGFRGVPLGRREQYARSVHAEMLRGTESDGGDGA